MHAQQHAKQVLHWRRAAGIALGALLTLAATGPAQAFTYVPGNLVAIAVENGTEQIVNLGSLASLTSGTSLTFLTPAAFGSDGATGAKFIAYETEAPFSGTNGRNVSFTTQAGVNPASFDANVSGYVIKLALAQSALDDGDATPDKFLQNLNSFPLAPNGGVIENTANNLVISTTNASSYTTTIGVSGTSDRISNQLPFETDNLIGTSTQIELWRAVRATTTTAQSTLLGYLTVEGNVAGLGEPATTRITFTAIPEPGSLLLLGAGLTGLAAMGRRRTS